MNEAVFSATYSDWKLIRTRKVVQIVLEVPLEAADHAYQVVGGMPKAGEETWFAVARLKEQPIKAPPQPVHRLVQRAGILCNDQEFINFCQIKHSLAPKLAIYKLCEISSRKELATNQQAQILFERLLGEFEGWRRGIE